MMLLKVLAISMCLVFNLSAAQAGVEEDILNATRDNLTKTVADILKNNPKLDLLSPRTRDSDDNTLLHWGVGRRNIEIVRMLLNFDPQIAPRLLAAKNFFGSTALHWAGGSEQTEIVELLLNFDRKITQQILTSRNNEGRNPLHWAAERENTEIAKLFLDFDGEITPQLLTAKDAVKQTPLQLAVNGGHTEIVKLLLNFDPKIAKDLILIQDNEGKTSLHKATESSRTKMISTLIEFDNSEEFVNIVDTSKNSALGRAIFFGRSSVVAIFVRNGVSLDEVTILGKKTSALEFLSNIENYEKVDKHIAQKRIELLQHILTGRIQSQPEMDWEKP